MIANKHYIIGLHLLVTYHVAKSFVIFSANVADVKRIAKEFSGPLTDEIVELILKATKNYTINTPDVIEAQSYKSNHNSLEKHKHKNILRNKDGPIPAANYYTEEIPKYSSHFSPKIHNFAKVNTESQRIYSTSKSYNVMSLSNHIAPPSVPKNIEKVLNEPKKYYYDDLNQKAPKILSNILNKPIEYQNKDLYHITPPQIPKISSKILNEAKPWYLNHIAPPQVPKIPSEKFSVPNKYHNDDQNHQNYVALRQIPKISNKNVNKAKIYYTDDPNNVSIEKKTTKKRDTSTKLIEFNSNSAEEIDFHDYKPSSKKRKKKSKTMQTIEIINQETRSTKTTLEAKVSTKKKTKRLKTVQTATQTEETTHDDEPTVDIELQKFEKEVHSYLTSKIYPSATSKTTLSKDSNSDSTIKEIHSKSKKFKSHTKGNEVTEGTTLNLMRLAAKIERLDQVAQNFMSSSRKISSTKPTPAYPKQYYNEYKIPNSEYKLSYDPNQRVNYEDNSHMDARFFNRYQRNNESPESVMQRTNTIDQLSEVIQKIIETRLNSKLLKTTDSSRRQHVASRPSGLHKSQGVLTNSEEETIFKIIKAMIDTRKIKALQSPRYAKEKSLEIKTRSTIKAFNIHKMSPEEKMANVIHKMVDSSLRMQFEKPQMSASALAEILKNKYYENQKALGNEHKVSEMIEKLIEKKIHEYAQTTTKILHSKPFHTETKPNPYSKDRRWPKFRPSYKNIARVQSTTKYTSAPTRYQTQTRPTEVNEIQKIEFQIPYAEYHRTSSTITTKLTDKPALRKENSKKRHHNQHTSLLQAKGSAIKISHDRQGPISIVIEDKEIDETKRPIPQAFLLQKPHIEDRPSPHIIVVDNRHIEPASTKTSYKQEDIKTEIIKKILREETTNQTDTITKKHKDIRSGDEIQLNQGDSYGNKIPNVQLVFLNIPQLESKENEKKKINEKNKTEEEKKKGDKEVEEERRLEEQKRIEEDKSRKIKEEERRREEEKRKEEERRREEQKRKEEEKRQEEKRTEEEKKKEEEKRQEEKKRRDEEKKREEQKIKEEKRLEEEKRKEEEKRREEERRIEEEKKKEEERRREEEMKIEEDKRREEKKRIEEKRQKEKRKEEEIRKELERQESEKKALRQKIEKEVREKEILWEKDLENKIKENQKADEVAVMQEAEIKRKEVEKKLLDQKLLLMQEKFKNDLKIALQVKHNNEIQTTHKTTQSTTTLNYWEQQWQQDQELKLGDEYNKYMKLHGAGTGLSDKRINYWNEQWRIELEKKLREKQKADHEQTKPTPTNHWLNAELPATFYNLEKKGTTTKPTLIELVSNQPLYVAITDAFGNMIDNQEILKTEPSNSFVHNWRPRDKLIQQSLGNGKSIPKRIVIRASAIPKRNRFDARRGEDYSDSLYIIDDGRKEDKLLIKSVQDRSKKVTVMTDMSNEHSDKKYSMIKSDTVILEEKNDWRKPKRGLSKKVTATQDITEEQTKNSIDDKTSEKITSDNEIDTKNYKTESEAIKERNENTLRQRSDSKKKSKHRKNKKDKLELKGEEQSEEKIPNKKINKDKEDNNIKLRKRKKNKKEDYMKNAKKIKSKNKNKSTENNENSKHEDRDIEHKKLKEMHRKVNNKKVKKNNNYEDELDKENESKGIRKIKHRKGKKNIARDERDNERDQKHKEQEKYVRETKHKKGGKDIVKIDETREEEKPIHRKEKKVKGTHEDEDKSEEEASVYEEEEKNTKHKKSKSVNGLSKSNFEKEENEKINKNDEDDGGREFDFQLMIGEKPT